jgi:hypothetical protein
MRWRVITEKMALAFKRTIWGSSGTLLTVKTGSKTLGLKRDRCTLMKITFKKVGAF